MMHPVIKNFIDSVLIYLTLCPEETVFERIDIIYDNEVKRYAEKAN